MKHFIAVLCAVMLSGAGGIAGAYEEVTVTEGGIPRRHRDAGWEGAQAKGLQSDYVAGPILLRAHF